MTPERWQQLKLLFGQALELPPAKRARFAEEACGGDGELLRQLRELLASDEEAGSFLLETLRSEARVPAEPAPWAATLAAGTLLEDKYRIEGVVGRGGMGEVYRARDTRIGRDVAVKVLPAYLSTDRERLLRFEREARAAGALNHPNLLALYDIGTHAGVPYLITELLRGRPLRVAMAEGRPSLATAIGYAAQVAQGLAAAHDVGVVHRDVKPENLFVRSDGYVKILDFGLAKLTQERATLDSDLTAGQLVDTNPGVVMGTPAYMSPEQARGLAVDARTDVWSLGVVLYEMMAGRLPFDGTTASDMIAAILTAEPTPLGRVVEGLPAELEAIVAKSLAKEPEARYATARELAADLKRLEHRLEVEQEPDGAAARGVGGGGGARATPPAGAATAEAGHRTSRVGFLVGALGRHKWALGALVAVLVLVAGAIAYRETRNGEARPSAAPFQSAEFTKLVAAGETVAAAISPDGKLIARAVVDEGGQSLWTRQVATLAGLQIVPPANVTFVGVTFSPSGEYVYYAARAPATKATLYRVPALGGESTRVIADIDGAVAFSPDGKRIAFVREDVSTGTSNLVVSDADGGGERLVSTKHLPLRWFTTPGSPAWSPDGTKIACGLGNLSAREDACSVVEVPADGGEERRITPPHPEWWIIGQVAWMPNGEGLVACVAEAAPSGPRWQIVSIAYPGGEVRRVTNDTHHYVWASLTKDGGKLLVVELTFRSAIWSFERADSKRGRQLTFGEGDGISGLACGPDGRLVFADVANSIWVADEDGSNPRLLTGDDHTNRLPCFTPDGSSIVFNSWRDGPPALWRMDVDGGNVVRLTSGPDDDVPRCSPDRWVYFTSTTRSGSPALYKVSLEGGPVVLASAESVVRAVPSPDGRWIACVLQRPNGQGSLAVMPAEGGAMRPLADVGGETVVRWRRDGKAVSYAVGGQVWEKPLDAGPAKRLLMLDGGAIFEFDWSPDGTRLVAALGKQETSLVIIGAHK